jgi:transposase InsO family protein
VIFHSDRGCQYTSKEFADFCAINGLRRSSGRRATCYDNAVTESFFATYKKELIHTRPWTISPRSNNTPSSGSKATTTAGDDTPPSTT